MREKLNNNLRLLTESEEGYGIIVEWITKGGCSGSVGDRIEDTTLIKEYQVLSRKLHEGLGDASDTESIFMNCILQKCDTQNRNGRYYPRELLEREDAKYQELIREGRALGAADHPDITYISLKSGEVSHRVIKTWWEGNTLHGILEIMTSRAYHEMGGIFCEGDQVANLLRKGVKLGISSRGIGTLKNIGGKNTVQKDFELICYDLVSTPSTPGAFLYPKTEINLRESEEIEKTNLLISNSLEKKLKKFLK